MYSTCFSLLSAGYCDRTRLDCVCDRGVRARPLLFVGFIANVNDFWLCEECDVDDCCRWCMGSVLNEVVASLRLLPLWKDVREGRLLDAMVLPELVVGLMGIVDAMIL